MNGCFPLRACLECLQGPSLSVTRSYAHLREDLATPTIKLDRSHMGQNIVLLKEDTRICGTGAALGLMERRFGKGNRIFKGTVPILQNKAYFEVKIQQTGIWGIGLGTRKCQLNTTVRKDGWLLSEDGSFWADGKLIGKLQQPIGEGDTIGLAFDHVELKFYRNDEVLPISIGEFRSSQNQSFYPLFYVDDSAILDVYFHTFTQKTPPGYEEIMIEQTLL